jgi:hypothetical protein
MKHQILFVLTYLAGKVFWRKMRVRPFTSSQHLEPQLQTAALRVSIPTAGDGIVGGVKQIKIVARQQIYSLYFFIPHWEREAPGVDT